MDELTDQDMLPHQRPSGGGLLGGVLVAGVWFFNAITAIYGSTRLMNLFQDFGVELPTATLILSHPVAVGLITMLLIGVLLGAVLMEPGAIRVWFVRIAGVSGLAVAILCVFAFVMPYLRLVGDLS